MNFIREETLTGSEIVVPKMFNGYQVTSLIGRGSSAVVLELEEMKSKRKFAAKAMNRADADDETMMLLEREFRFCVTITCPYLIKGHEMIEIGDVTIIVMEYFKSIDLLAMIEENMMAVHFKWKLIFTQICLAVQYLHQNGFAHRDIKPDNVLIDKEYNVKLCDYGFVCESSETTVSMSARGTVQYVAPEVLLRKGYCAMRLDVWSMGITLFVAVAGCFPWDDPSNNDSVCNDIVDGRIDMGMLTDDARVVVERCCEPDPEKRATVDQLLAMSFVQMPVAKEQPVRSIGSLPVLVTTSCRRGRLLVKPVPVKQGSVPPEVRPTEVRPSQSHTGTFLGQFTGKRLLLNM